jgi:hypothetical protein
LVLVPPIWAPLPSALCSLPSALCPRPSRPSPPSLPSLFLPCPSCAVPTDWVSVFLWCLLAHQSHSSWLCRVFPYNKLPVSLPPAPLPRTFRLSVLSVLFPTTYCTIAHCQTLVTLIHITHIHIHIHRIFPSRWLSHRVSARPRRRSLSSSPRTLKRKKSECFLFLWLVLFSPSWMRRCGVLWC